MYVVYVVIAIVSLLHTIDKHFFIASCVAWQLFDFQTFLYHQREHTTNLSKARTKRLTVMAVKGWLVHNPRFRVFVYFTIFVIIVKIFF